MKEKRKGYRLKTEGENIGSGGGRRKGVSAEGRKAEIRGRRAGAKTKGKEKGQRSRERFAWKSDCVSAMVKNGLDVAFHAYLRARKKSKEF